MLMTLNNIFSISQFMDKWNRMKCVKVAKTGNNPHTAHTQEERILKGPESYNLHWHIMEWSKKIQQSFKYLSWYYKFRYHTHMSKTWPQTSNQWLQTSVQYNILLLNTNGEDSYLIEILYNLCHFLTYIQCLNY